MLQCAAVCCSVLQCIGWGGGDDSALLAARMKTMGTSAVCCSVLQCVSMSCSEMLAAHTNSTGKARSFSAGDSCEQVWGSVVAVSLQYVAVCCSVLHCVAVWCQCRCSMWQCVAACGSVLQGVPQCAVPLEGQMQVSEVYCVAVCCSMQQCVAGCSAVCSIFKGVGCQ